MLIGGGIPIVVDGVTVGAIGVSTGTPAQDIECATAGVEAVDAYVKRKSASQVAELAVGVGTDIWHNEGSGDDDGEMWAKEDVEADGKKGGDMNGTSLYDTQTALSAKSLAFFSPSRSQIPPSA